MSRFEPLVFPPSEPEVLNWFVNYDQAFDLRHNPAYNLRRNESELVRNVSCFYCHVFEKFKEHRRKVSRKDWEITRDLRVFGFDYYDLQCNVPIRFYSNFPAPMQYRPMPISGPSLLQNPGIQFPLVPGVDGAKQPGAGLPQFSGVIWPKGSPRRFIASYIRNSSSHGSTRVDDGIVTIENKEERSLVPNFRIYLPVREYLRLIATSLKYFVEHVLTGPYMNKNPLGMLKQHEYGRLVQFFQRLLARELAPQPNGQYGRPI